MDPIEPLKRCNIGYLNERPEGSIESRTLFLWGSSLSIKAQLEFLETRRSSACISSQLKPIIHNSLSPTPLPQATSTSFRNHPTTIAIMSRRYDSRTTIFSPEGRLYQVEYALEAISHAGTAIGILAADGIVLAAERKVTSKLLEQDTSAEKLYILNDNMLAAVAGMTADANILINYARQAAQRYLMTYGEEIPCEQLVRRLCDLKQGV